MGSTRNIGITGVWFAQPARTVATSAGNAHRPSAKERLQLERSERETLRKSTSH